MNRIKRKDAKAKRKLKSSSCKKEALDFLLYFFATLRLCVASHMRKIIFIGLCCTGILTAGAIKAPATRTTPTSSPYIGPSKEAFSFLQHDVNNHEEQLQALDRRLDSHETAWEALRQQGESCRNKMENLELRDDALERTIAELEAQQRQMRSQYNAIQQQLAAQDKLVDELRVTCLGLRQALSLVTEAIQLQGVSPSSGQEKEAGDSEKIYRVKSGDSLEKIARAHHISIQALKECNKITNDKIIVGQKLRIP